MSATREQLERQAATLNSINGLVRTMKALAAINAVPYEQAATAIQAYQTSLEQAFATFAFATQGRYAVSNKADFKAELKQQMWLVFGSDHGLCGSYNEQLALQVAKQQRQEQVQRNAANENSAYQAQILCVGARMQRALQDQGLEPYLTLLPPASVQGVKRLASLLVQQIYTFSQGRPLANLQVRLWFTQRSSNTTKLQSTNLAEPAFYQTLLPVPQQLLQAPKRWPVPALPLLTLPEDQLLTALLRQYMFVQLYRASAEALATENAARLALMQQAEQNLAQRLEEVNLHSSQVRQDEITTELMDIISGHLDLAGD